MTDTAIISDSWNKTTSASSARADGPPAVQSIVIVGGGTAGWMTALVLARSLIARGVDITLLESPTVAALGVGEGSTPWLRGFFDGLGIEEAEWMPECHATYKCGITFDGWCGKPGFESYFHPFASTLDNLTMTQFIHNAEARVKGVDVDARPGRFFLTAKLASRRLAPKPAENFPFDIWHGYHFDAVLLGQFLHKKALQRGVKYRACHVTHATVDEHGAIASVVTREGDTIRADLYVDCSGFAGLLIQQTLKTPFVTFAENLFNDAAVALPSPISGPIPCETVSTALRHGWAWKIPLTDRYGHGYVYSSRFCSANDAEYELRQHLGLLESDTPARHLKMKVGRVTEPWNKNCLANGLAQGFIEPLEATALMFIQRTATMFAEILELGDLGPAAHDRFNRKIHELFEGTRDYVVTHYKTNTRADTDYWRENAANERISDALKHLYTLWTTGKSIGPGVLKQDIGKGYPMVSWYAIMAGMGIFPDAHTLRAPHGAPAREIMTGLDDLLERSATNYRDHGAVLADIPPRRNDSLQFYLWR
ncbi:MAG TPA: tryptophan halogenase family protein [Steroidobacteraceae bacterium]